VSIHVGQLGFRRPAIVPAVHPPLLGHSQVAIKKRQQVVAGHHAAGKEMLRHPQARAAHCRHWWRTLHGRSAYPPLSVKFQRCAEVVKKRCTLSLPLDAMRAQQRLEGNQRRAAYLVLRERSFWRGEKFVVRTAGNGRRAKRSNDSLRPDLSADRYLG
jgi:hypothetical protein